MSDSHATQEQLRESLICRILAKECSDGQIIPSTRSIAASTGAHPQTIAKAYRPLIDAGILIKQAGRGTYVAEGGHRRLLQQERERFLSARLPSFQQEAERLGFKLLLKEPKS